MRSRYEQGQRKLKKKVGRKVWEPRRIGVAVGIFALALAVRAVYLYDSSDNPTFLAPVVDSLTYDLNARDLANGLAMSREFFWQQFFYPFFLSIVYFISNSSIVFAKVVQILLGSVTCVLTYLLGKRLFGRRAGIAAGVIAAVYGPLIFFEAELLAAGWAGFWAVLLILLLLEMKEEVRLKLCFVVGLCAALSVITRANFVPFAIACAVWLMVVWIRQKVGIKKFTLQWLVLISGFGAVILPVAAKNYQMTGRFSFLPGTGGLNLYIGNNLQFEAAAFRPGEPWKELVELPLRNGYKAPDERQRFFYGRTWQYLREQPGDFLKGLARKTVELAGSREMPGHIDPYLFRKWSPMLKVLMWKVGGFGFPFGILLPLSLLGLFSYWRKVPVPVWLFLVLYPASVILTHVEARYRIPIILPMCVLAGAGVVKTIEWGRLRRWPKVIGAAVFCAAAAFACSMAGPFYAEKNIDYEVELHYVLGGSLKDHGKIDEAMASYREAIHLKPDYLEAYKNLGSLLAEQRKFAEAVKHYSTAMAIFPDEAALHEGLGLVLFEQGKINQAVEQYNRAIEIDAQRASAYDNLGRAFFSLNRPNEAQEHFNKSIELNPSQAVTHSNMGSLLASQGKIPEAIEHFEESLRLSPNRAWTLSNLGSAYSCLAEFSKAEEKFEAALRIAPDDAYTYFNLGVCLQQQGRTTEAMEKFGRALVIDPEHRGARQAISELRR
ncbi:MAG: tetratricopeptide repeat protein, partial [Planctomycetota bacterium]